MPAHQYTMTLGVDGEDVEVTFDVDRAIATVIEVTVTAEDDAEAMRLEERIMGDHALTERLIDHALSHEA